MFKILVKKQIDNDTIYRHRNGPDETNHIRWVTDQYAIDLIYSGTVLRVLAYKPGNRTQANALKPNSKYLLRHIYALMIKYKYSVGRCPGIHKSMLQDIQEKKRRCSDEKYEEILKRNKERRLRLERLQELEKKNRVAPKMDREEVLLKYGSDADNLLQKLKEDGLLDGVWRYKNDG
jgi:hypothetical protein